MGKGWIKTTVLKIDNDLRGEPFGTLVTLINDAWSLIPIECRDSSAFKSGSSFDGGITLHVWYYRPDTDDDKRERAEYERLKAKFEDEEIVDKRED